MSSRMELTILMPCLNEVETLALCIHKARGFLEQSQIAGEIVVADNGSTDGSPEIAASLGARVVHISETGYGAALQGGIDAARGRYVIMGDADDSYDFSDLQPFVDRLRDGADLVIGNRFRGGIAKGAMPPLHRYLGNPMLSRIGRQFFNIKIGDFHCGLRGFDREKLHSLQLRSQGMEFASEMVVRATLARFRVEEVPTTLSPHGRSRRPHLRPWRDGWRHLRFLLALSPRWLFLYPGIGLVALGAVSVAFLLPGPMQIAGITFDLKSFLGACIAVLLGLQAISFAVVAQRLGSAHGILPQAGKLSTTLHGVTLERSLFVALLLVLGGLAGLVWSLVQWADVRFGPLDEPQVFRWFALSLTMAASGAQIALAAFLSTALDLLLKSEREPS